MIELENVVKVYHSANKSIKILDNITLRITAGESVAITGASGSGKSTLLALMAGLDIASAGSIKITGKALEQMNEDQRAALRADTIGFVFQSFHLLPNMTALENVMLPLELKGLSSAKQKAAALLQEVGLAERLAHYPEQMSGGEQQRVAIARAFANQPVILFADEPTGNLDSKTGHLIIDLLFKLNNAYNTTLVLVTHEARLANYCQRQVNLVDGQLAVDKAGCKQVQR